MAIVTRTQTAAAQCLFSCQNDVEGEILYSFCFNSKPFSVYKLSRLFPGFKIKKITFNF